MPKPPPLEVEVVCNEDPAVAEAAAKAALKLLIRYILEDRGADVPETLTEEPEA
jgi:hypothetical protein